jgi:hypothetical protein
LTNFPYLLQYLYATGNNSHEDSIRPVAHGSHYTLTKKQYVKYLTLQFPPFYTDKRNVCSNFPFGGNPVPEWGKTAFGVVIAYMRDMKRRYFLTPPLTDADYIALGLNPHDPIPSGPPTSQVTIETYLLGRHELGVKNIYVTGSPTDPANRGFKIWYSVVAPGEKAPRQPRRFTQIILHQAEKGRNRIRLWEQREDGIFCRTDRERR